MRRPLIAAAAVALAAAAGAAPGGAPGPGGASAARAAPTAPAPVYPTVHWRGSLALGVPWRGRLVRGVLLPAQGLDFFTWDPVVRRSPNRSWRRWGHDRLIHTLLRVLADYRALHPEAGRVGIGDLSRPQGGPFGRRFGGLGHDSHQNGLDVDLWYPRLDGLERRPSRVPQIDTGLAQELVDLWVGAGAQRVFVGPHTGLTGPSRIVQPLAHHDDHMHVRLPSRPGGR